MIANKELENRMKSSSKNISRMRLNVITLVLYFTESYTLYVTETSQDFAGDFYITLANEIIKNMFIKYLFSRTVRNHVD